MTTKLFLMFFKLLLDLVVGKENNLLDMIRILLTNCLFGINLYLIEIQSKPPTYCGISVVHIDTDKFLEAQDFIPHTHTFNKREHMD